MFRPRRLIFVLLLVALFCTLLRPSARMQSPLRRITNTTEEGININPSMSGDGRFVAFESTEDVGGAGGVEGFRAIRANVSVDPPTFLQIAATRAPAPAISQDGSRIAFASKDNPLGTNSDRNSEIFLYDGAQLLQVTNTLPGDIAHRTVNGNYLPSISDDGRFIAFSSNRDLAGQNPDGNLEIFIFDSAAASFTQLTNSSGIVGFSDAKISGDGASVAYVRDSGATQSVNRDLLLQNRVGAPSLHTLAINAQNLALTFGRAISDDGKRVVWSSEIATNSSQVFLYDGRNNQTRQITSLSSRVTEVPLHSTLNGDGTRIAFATRRSVSGAGSNSDGSVELYTYEIPSGTFGRVTNTSSNTATAEVLSSMNDDGSIIAFNFPRVLTGVINEASGNNSEIYVAATPARPAFGNLTIQNGASFGHEPSTTEAVAPDSIAVAFGDRLSNTTEQAQQQPDGSFPLAVGGTTVTVNGRRAQIFYVSPTQVNFHVPAATELGTPEVIVTNSDGFPSRGTVASLSAAPGVFTYDGDGLGEGVILDADMLQPGPFDPTSGTLRLIIFSTGLSNGVRNGVQVSVSAGGRALAFESIMPSPNMPGLDEVHVLVPADLRGAGQVDLVIRANSRDSNPVAVTFAGDSHRDIVINEFLADPPGSAATDASGDANHDGTRDSGDDEFVELVNATTHDINISGYQILTRGTSGSSDVIRHTFASGTILPACSAIVVFGGGNPNASNPVFDGAQIVKASSGSLSLINTSGVITLRDPSAGVVNLVTYGGSSGLNANADQSLTRSPDITGSFTLHQAASGPGGAAFSPGTRLNGSAFSVCPAIARIEVSPPAAAIDEGAHQQFMAQAYDANNQPLAGVIFFWESSNTAVAVIDQNGLATGMSSGTTEIRASGRGVQSPPVRLTVNAIRRALTMIEVTPNPGTIPVSGTQQFTARGFDQFGHEMLGLTFTWESTDTNIATVDANGVATGVNQGQTTIKARSGTVTGIATLDVTPPTVAFNEVLADPAGSAAGDLQGDANHDGVRSSGDDEFVELVNSTDGAINISGWSVRTHSASSTTEAVRHTFAPNTTLSTSDTIVIFGGGGVNFNPDDGVFGCAQVVKASSGGLSLTNSGLTIVLRDGSGNVVAQFSYGGSTGLAGDNDQSLTRSPDITGNFAQHLAAAGAGGRRFSPGTRGNGTPFANCPPRLTSVTISPASSNVLVGQSTQFTAQAFDQFGQSMIGIAISFTSDNTSVAPVDSVTTNPGTGVATATVTGQSAGTAHITAIATDGTTTVLSSQAMLGVDSATPVLTSVTIAPPSATVDTEQAQSFTAQALDQFGQPIGGVTITFASNNLTVATVDSVTPTSSTDSATATVTGHANGSAEIRATADNGSGTTVTSMPAILTVAQVVNAGDVLISEFRLRGSNGANDEFIELYNRTTHAIDISGFKIFRSNNTGTRNLHATITSAMMLQPGCHYLLTNSNASGPYNDGVAGDQTYGTGIADDGGIALTLASGTDSTGIIDQVGLSSGSAYKEGTSLASLGTTNVDHSYERKPGGGSGNGTDANDNSTDFLLNAGNSNPQSLASGCLDLSTADLAITKTDSPDPVITGSDVTYTIIVTNNGARIAQSVVVTDNLPAGTTFVSCASTGNGVCGGSGNNRTISFSSLAGGESATITLVSTANSAGGTTITNTATVSSATSDPNAANNSDTETTDVQAVSPAITIDDVSALEGDSGSTTFTFTIHLSTVAPVGGSTFNITTADGTAQDHNPPTEDSDYVAKTFSGQTIPAGQQDYQFSVTVNSDKLVEADETFFVNVTPVSGATLSGGDGQGLGTITNDDTPLLVISQLYGGGGNSGAPFTHDFIEIFNRGSTTVNLSGWSVQYIGATSTGTWSVTNLSATLQPRQYYLVQEGSGGAVGSPLPTPDSTGTIPMAAAAGKVALVSNTTPLIGACPATVNIIDLLGYGGTASCFEGTAPAPGPGATAADFRRAGGCTDTNDNAADFFVLAPGPRNTVSALNSCAPGTPPTLSIDDVIVTEGNSGPVTATFTVSLSTPANGADVTFDFATQDNTATTANSDYVAKTLTNQIIPAGRQIYTFTVTVNGDTAIENNETFLVNVTNVSGATVTDGQGVGTIQNDDVPSISINDVSQNEGDSGAAIFSFTVSLSAPAPTGGVTFDIATQDNTATVADNDFVARALTSLTIPAGSSIYNFDVTVNGDTNIELNESFLVNVTSVLGATVADGQGQGTILNDDSPRLTINDVLQSEGDSGATTFTFTVTSSLPAPAGGITFDIATADGTAQDDSPPTEDSDYVAKSLTGQTITPGNTTYTFDVTVNGDTFVEPGESLFVNVTNVSGATVLDGRGQGTMQNDDTAVLVISQVYGGGGLTGASFKNDFVEIFNQGTTTVNFTVTPYSIQYAGATSNFGGTNTTTVINSGMIAPGQYYLVEESSGGAVGAALPPPDAPVGNINLAATAGKVALVIGIAAVNLTSCPGDDLSTAPLNPTDNNIVDFMGFGNLATCYEGPTGPGPAPSNTTADFRKAGGCADTDNNAADFLVAAPFPRNSSSPVNNCIAGAPPNLTINDVTVAEGDSGTTTATFTVSLSGPAPSTDVTFNIATQNNSATTANSDYVTHSLTHQVIPAGAQSSTFSVTVNSDTAVEPDETFFVNVTSVSGATVINGQGVGTIQNDDVPILTVSDVSANEGNTGPTTFSFLVHLSVPAPSTVTFDVATADGTAQDNTPPGEDNDYVARSIVGQTIAAGQQDFTFEVTVNGDVNIESTETFFVNVTNVSGATLTGGDGQGLGTIQNDDSPSLSINDVTMSEGDSGTKDFTFTVSLSPSNQTVTVNYSTADGSATAPGDYTSHSTTQLSFAPGETTKPVTVGVNGDTLVEANETFFVTLNGETNATIFDPQGVGTITNDDAANLVISQVYGGGNNSGAPYRNDFIEIFNRGVTTVNFLLTPYSVQYTSGTTWAKTDITSGTLAPGQYFLIQEAGGTSNGAALPTADATGSINLTNGSSAKVALVAGTMALAGACPGDDLSQPFNPNFASIVDLVGYGGTAATADHCYEGAGSAPAQTNTTADFRKAGGCTDTDNNAADFLVAAPFPRNSGSPVDNCVAGTPPNLSINDVTIAEGNSGTTTATFTVSLSTPAPSTDVTFNIATQNNTATTANSDYVAHSLTNQVIPAGAQTYTFSVSVNGDTAIEPDETFFVNVTSVSGATVTDGQGVGIIQNDDVPTLTINDVSLTEGNGGTKLFTFNVSLSTAAPSPVTFDIATADGTAQDGGVSEDTDYVAISETAQTIGTGLTSYTFDVTVNGDLTIEANEIFFVNVTNVSGATVSDSQGQGTIQNDDSPTISIDDVTANEGNAGGTLFTFTVTSSLSAPAGGITFDIATADGTAQDDTPPSEDNDYVAKSLTSQTIPATQTTYTFEVTVNGDTKTEAICETFFVNLSNPTNATITDPQGQGRITDDDGTKLVISQIYGGGGNASAPYTSDFIELFNRGNSPVSLNGLSVQYAPATGTTGTYDVTILPNVTLQPGQYFLIREASGGGIGSALPTPDATGTIALAATAGRVALVNGTTALSRATCPSVNILDFVGYGTTAICREGSTTADNAPAPSATTADIRKQSGCQDTGNNATDFVAGAPTPRNTTTQLNACSCSTSYSSTFILFGFESSKDELALLNYDIQSVIDYSATSVGQQIQNREQTGVPARAARVGW